MDLAKLKAEIADAKYKDMGDEAIADALNERTAQVDREVLTGGELASCVTLADYTGLQPVQRQYMDMLVASASMPLSANVRTQLTTMFSAQSDTRKNLVLLLKRSGTRAEELGLGRVTTSDVAVARRS